MGFLCEKKFNGGDNYGKFKKNSNKKWYFVTKIVLTYCEKKLF